MDKTSYCIFANEENTESLVKKIDMLSNHSFVQTQLDEMHSGICFVLGGDGSLNYALNQLMSHKFKNEISLCYLPRGTGNDFARGTGLFEMEEDKILRLIWDVEPTNIFPGKFNEKYFLNMASCGEFSRVTTDVNENLKTYLKTWSYIISGLEKILDLKPQKLSYSTSSELDNNKNCLGFFIGNSRYCGGGFLATPEADARKKNLEALFVGDISLGELVKLGLELQSDQPQLDGFDVDYFELERMVVNSQSKIKATLDGEKYECDRAEISISKEPLKMFLPV